MTKALPSKSLVLYADDDNDDIELVRELFADFEAVVKLVTFPNGKALLEYITLLPPLLPQPSLVILDINMPVQDGLHTLKALRQLDDMQHVPVVLFTTSNMPHEESVAKSLGAGFITKPVYADQLHQIVDQMLHYCHDDFKKKIERHRGR
ncbi:MAG: response regulator [Flaviaesturariibacter sp.]|nr:response regulator [Flaviaesturariibacter sp.]